MLLLRRLAALLACVAALVPRATRPLQIPRGGATRPGRALQIPRGGARDDGGYYAALGLDPKCTQRDVDKAYRRKSLRCHPDKGGDPEEFKKLNEAREVLSDPAKRKQYDRFGKAGVDGAPGGMPQGNPFAGFSQGGNNAQAQQMFEQMFGGFGSAFGDAFGGMGGFGRPQPRRFAITVSLDDCFTGRTLSVALENNVRCRVKLAPGVGEGDVVKARAGDAVVQFELREAPHALYKRRGADLLLDARISLGDALGGGPSVEVARPDGSTFRVKLAREGDVLKHGALRCVEGEGMPVRGAPGKRGRLYLRVQVEFPDALDLDEDRRRELERILGLPPSSPSSSNAGGGDRVARRAAAGEWKTARRRPPPSPGFGFAFR